MLCVNDIIINENNKGVTGMQTESSVRKKMTDVYILEILKEYTDETRDSDGNLVNSMTQAEITKKLYDIYGISLDRKAVKRGLSDLTDSPEFADIVICDRLPKNVKCADEDGTETCTNYRYHHELDSDQISLLTEAILFSKNIPEYECRELIEQLSKLGGVASRKKLSKSLSKLSLISKDKVINEQIVANIGIIDEAIEKKRQVSFIYNDYGKDKKLHPKRDAVGNPVMRIANPYSIVANNEKYYLTCNYDEFDDVKNIRIDKITHIKILDKPAKPKSRVRGLKDVPATAAEQLYMQTGTPLRTVFRASKSIISDLIDWFGQSIRFTKEEDESILCEVKVIPEAMKYWAMQYSDYVEILEPASLRDKIIDSIIAAKRKYCGDDAQAEDHADDYDKLIKEWEIAAEKSLEGVVDVKELGDIVRKSHLLLLPLRNREYVSSFSRSASKNQNNFIYFLGQIEKKCRHLSMPPAYALAVIANALVKEVEKGDFYAKKNLPDNILPVYSYFVKTNKDSRFSIDVNNFDEDFLTLLQSANEEWQSLHAELEKSRQNRPLRKKQDNKNSTVRTEKDKPLACCFTGHRPEKLKSGEEDIKKALRPVVEQAVADGDTDFIVGMAPGVDIWAAEIVLELKKKNDSIKLICAKPFPNFCNRRHKDYTERAQNIMSQAFSVYDVSDGYQRDCYIKRDRWMVDNSSRVIAVFNGTPGGTKYTIDYATGKGKDVRTVEVE